MTDIDIIIARNSAFYGITMEEGRARYDKIQAQGDDPTKPICVGCARTPEETPVYVDFGGAAQQTATEYVLENEGTLNTTNGHYLCDECYIRNGQPTGDRGRRWVCP